MPERNRGYLREQRLKSIKKRRRLIKDQKKIFWMVSWRMY